MSYIKKLWFEAGLYPTEDFDFGEEFFENDYDFFDIDDDAPVEGDDDGKFNFGSLDDNEPHAVGDYDMNEDGLTIDYDFYDIDEDPPVTGDDDGVFNFIDSEDEPEAEGDWDFNKDIPVDPDPENNIDFYDIDEDPPVVGPDDEVFNMGDLNPNDVPLPDYDFYSVDEDPPVEGDLQAWFDDLLAHFTCVECCAACNLASRSSVSAASSGCKSDRNKHGAEPLKRSDSSLQQAEDRKAGRCDRPYL